MMNKKYKLLATALITAAMLLCSACGAYEESSSETQSQSSTALLTTEKAADSSLSTAQPETKAAASENSMKLTVGDTDFDIALENNETVSALKELMPLTIDMSELNGNEKYYYLDTALPSAPVKVGNISAGDVMLYGNNCLVVFYKSFSTSYSYTKIGHISETSKLESTLGNGSINAAFSMPSNEHSGNTLVAYFSRTGNTEKIAEHLIELTGADSYVINAAIPYTDADIKYQDDSCRANKEQNDKSVRPEIASPLSSIDSYDTIFLGYPIWWGQEPRIIDTFLESFDFSDKTVIPFCTSGSSGITASEANIKALVPIGKQLSGRRFSASASEKEVSDWLGSLDIQLKIDIIYTAQDLRDLSDFILGKSADSDLEGKDYDLDGDGIWSSFDLCLMRQKVRVPDTKSEAI